MAISYLYSPDGKDPEEEDTSFTHDIFWKNKGIRSKSFNVYVLSDAEEDHVEGTNRDTMDYQLYTAGSSLIATPDGTCQENTLRQWAKLYPSLVSYIKLHLGKKRHLFLNGKNSANIGPTPWDGNARKKYSQLFLNKKQGDGDEITASTGSVTSSERSPVRAKREDFWLSQLEELHCLVQQNHNQISDARKKISLSERAKELGKWLETQVDLARGGQLEPSKLCYLVDMGLSWQEDDAQWNQNYQSLLAMYQLLFTKTKRRPLLAVDSTLENWAQTQIVQGKRLPQPRRRLLRALRRRLAKKLPVETRAEQWKAFHLLCHRVVSNHVGEALAGKGKRPVPGAHPQSKDRVQKRVKTNHNAWSPEESESDNGPSSPSPRRNNLPILRLDSDFSTQLETRKQKTLANAVDSDLDWLFKDDMASPSPGPAECEIPTPDIPAFPATNRRLHFGGKMTNYSYFAG